jgi:hypothetical protein
MNRLPDGALDPALPCADSQHHGHSVHKSMANIGTRSSKRPELPRMSTVVAVTVILLLTIAIFRVGVDKHLRSTITVNEWGRYLFAIGAALTHTKFGIGGFVIDDPIEQKLQIEGLTDNPKMLSALGIEFPNNLRDDALLQRALERTRDFDVPPAPAGNYQRLRGSSGDDVGLATYASIAFYLFGLKVSAFYYAYFVLLGITIALFFLSHRDNAAAMACLALMMLAIYFLVISDLINFTREIPRYSGTPGGDIKDPRFFGTIAAIPALHLLVTWTRQNYYLSRVDYVALIGQSLVFTFVLHIRWPVIWLLAALLGFWLVLLASHPQSLKPKLHELRQWRAARSLGPVGVFILITIGGIVTTNIAAHPIYRIDGDVLHHPLWHHMMSSLQWNPEWSVKYLSTVNGVFGDAMPAEIAKQEIAKLPPDLQPQYVSRIGWPKNEAIAGFARQRFFEIFQSDPWFVFHTFLIDNPRRIILAAVSFYIELIQALSSANIIIAIGALIIIAWVAASDPETSALFPMLIRGGFAFSLLALLPNTIATTDQFVLIDHFIWSLFFLCLLACFVSLHVARKLRNAVGAFGEIKRR